jgi:hypothetical protein
VREGPETPRLSSWRPSRERIRARPCATSPRWSSLVHVVRSEEGESEEWMSWRGAGQSSVRAAFEADLRVGTPLVRRHRAISGSTETGPRTRGARSRRRRAGTRGSFTHPKAPRPRASAATGPAPCRLASRPSEVAAVGTSDEAQLRLLVSNVLRRRFDFGIFLHVALSDITRAFGLARLGRRDTAASRGGERARCVTARASRWWSPTRRSSTWC